MSWKIGVTLDARQFKVELSQGDPIFNEPARAQPWYQRWIMAVAGVFTGFACYHLWQVW